MLLGLLGNWSARHADAVVGVSEGVARDMEVRLGLPAGAVTRIYNPAWNDRMAAQKGRRVSHRWLRKERRYPTLISVGRLTRQKDYPTLLRAFADVLKRRKAKLIILGEGEDRLSLERLSKQLGIDEDVDMPGYVEDPIAHVASADLFVLSSAWEGFGNVIVEALGAGTPVIATDCQSGPAEILGGGRYGRLVPVGDSNALARAVLEELSMERSSELMAERANDFHAFRIAKEYIQLAASLT
jgi:glycosyltransferase involved in cell wall biosynthesis